MIKRIWNKWFPQEPLIQRVDPETIVVSGANTWDYPDFADSYVESAEFLNGEPLTEDELTALQEENPELAPEYALGQYI